MVRTQAGIARTAKVGNGLSWRNSYWNSCLHQYEILGIKLVPMQTEFKYCMSALKAACCNNRSKVIMEREREGGGELIEEQKGIPHKEGTALIVLPALQGEQVMSRSCHKWYAT